jgi:hypothetical protein
VHQLGGLLDPLVTIAGKRAGPVTNISNDSKIIEHWLATDFSEAVQASIYISKSLGEHVYHLTLRVKCITVQSRCQLPTTQLSKINLGDCGPMHWTNRRRTTLSEQRPNLLAAKPVKNHHPWHAQNRPSITRELQLTPDQLPPNEH